MLYSLDTYSWLSTKAEGLLRLLGRDARILPAGDPVERLRKLLVESTFGDGGLSDVAPCGLLRA
ncbi:hypothetical protein EON64_18790 [archaeon]|nr:MAG: hypothetical protein EON64_18790 [archaeon]